MENDFKITSILSKKSTKKNCKPPKHLSLEMKRWWTSVDAGYQLQDHHRLLLTKACEAYDRAEGARQTIAKLGTTFEDRFKQPCARPEIQIERDSRLAFARLVRELALSEELPRDSRPPSLKFGGRK